MVAPTAFAATITVNTAGASSVGDGFCSLQEALNNTNSNGELSAGDCSSGEAVPIVDVIEFAIPGIGPHTIATVSQFSVDEAVVIDGTTQAGTVCTLEGGIRQLQININASGINSSSNIFNIGNIGDPVDNVTIKGLALYGNEYGSGVATWSNSTVLQCNNIGTNGDGLVAYPNFNGISIYDNDTNIPRTGIVIGGPNSGDGNIISGNGIIDNNTSFDGWGIAGAGQGMIIQGNWIGVDRTGQVALGNLNAGITFGNGAIVEYNGIEILGNVISGNGVSDESYSPGINIGGSDESGNYEPVTDLVIKGNIVGLSADGLIDLGNENDGIGIFAEAVGVTIGGPLEGERNIISGNGANGINIGYDVENVIIQGNYIGTDITGEVAAGNDSLGVNISDGDRAQIITNIVIGGDTEAKGNIISGNGNSGIYIDADNVTISANKIGTNPAGLACIQNGNQGIQNSALTTNMLIGGDTLGERNIIGCSTNDGLYLEGSTTVQGNYIGVGGDGETDLGSGMGAGINFLGEVIIGGDTVAKGNLIRYFQGIAIKATAPSGSSLIQNNRILDNNIGVSIFGMTSNRSPIVTLLQNSITNNTQIGIDLGNDSDDDYNVDGVGGSVQNINDDNDTDSGPNGYLNHPIVLMTMQDGADTRVLYGLNVPVGFYRVEFFTNPTHGVSTSGFGEGETYEDYVILSKTIEGFETYTKTLTDVDLNDDITLTVTACTDSGCTNYQGTSEFSNTAPPGVDYDSTEYTASHVLNTIYLGVCVNGDNGNSTNTDSMGPNQIGAYLGTGPCINDRDGVAFVKNEMIQSGPTLQEQYTEIADTPSVDDATFTGTYTGTENNEFQLAFASTSPDNGDDADYFIWIDTNDNIISEPIKVTPGVPQLLDHGIYVTFSSGTGHTAIDFDNFSFGQVWAVAANPGGLIPSNELYTGTYTLGQDIALSVTASNSGYVHIWIDNNQDGDFTDADEWMVVNESVVAGANGFVVSAPGAAGTYTMRVRYVGTSIPNLSPTGVANDGEVEDYQFTVTDSISVPVTTGGSIGHLPRLVFTPTTTSIKSVPSQNTVVDILGSGTCPAELIISDFMKQGDRNGRYSTYNRKVVKDIKKLQGHINRILAAHYNHAAGPIDGIFGKLTKRGVERLQIALNTVLKPIPVLKVDGIVGPYTRDAINNSCGK